MPQLSKYVQPLHFEDFDGPQFERLVFAYHARTDKWQSLEWYGQTGSDLGRDIWGIRGDSGETICVQCVNREKLTLTKARSDIAKVLSSINGTPQRFRFVTRSKVSSALRDKIRAHALTNGITNCDIWSGAEFEEFLRRDAESLLKRFTEGEPFPDAAPDLLALAQADILSDDDALSMMARLFDRPAFYTPILQESNLGDFKQAVTDTIQALGTGILKARDGQLIERIPSRHHLRDEGLRKKVQAVEKALAKLRARFDELVRTGVVRHCNCNHPQCPTYFMPPEAASELEHLRHDAVGLFRAAHHEVEEPRW